MAFPWFAENHYSEKDFFVGERWQFSNQSFLCDWHFISISWQRIQSQIEKLKTIRNESDTSPLYWNSSKSESRFLQRVRIWYNHFITRQFLNGNFHVSDLKQNSFTKKIYWRKNIFSIKTSEITSDFDTNFHNASECESRILKRVRF